LQLQTRKFGSIKNRYERSVLWRLAHEGIDGASMFPGYDGIVKAMREKVLAKP
jgi:hypothetical protein